MSEHAGEATPGQPETAGQPEEPHATPPAPPQEGEPEADEELGGHAAHALGARIAELRDAEPGDPEPDDDADPRASLGLAPVTLADVEGTPYAPCPICQGWGCQDVDVMLAAFDKIVAELAPYPQSTVFERCPECNGWGSVLTGARRAEPGIQPCPACHGNGYRDKREQAAPEPPPAGAAGTPPAAPPPGLPDPMRLPPSQGGTPPAVGMVWDDARTSWVYPAA